MSLHKMSLKSLSLTSITDSKHFNEHCIVITYNCKISSLEDFGASYILMTESISNVSKNEEI